MNDDDDTHEKNGKATKNKKDIIIQLKMTSWHWVGVSSIYILGTNSNLE